jgi:hypothetical protein
MLKRLFSNFLDTHINWCNTITDAGWYIGLVGWEFGGKFEKGKVVNLRFPWMNKQIWYILE